MSESDFLKQLKSEYPTLIYDKYPFPSHFKGSKKIKAIVLGADPTKIVNKETVRFNMVFDLDKNNSPYWRGIEKNLSQIFEDSTENVYVQNVCRNYFTLETGKNKEWTHIARKYWIPFLANELDELFGKDIPILMTTEFILHASLKDPGKSFSAEDIYKQKIIISKDENLFSRDLIALYRHWNYNLNRHPEYRDFIVDIFKD